MASKMIKNGYAYWTGRTLKEANEKRDETLNRIFDPDNAPTPVVIFAYGFIGVVSRENDGYWLYSIRSPKGDRVDRWQASASVVGPTWTRFQAECACRRDLAQRVSDFTADGLPCRDGFDVISRADFDGLEEHRRWVYWQRAYAAARAEGKSDEEARRAAGSV